MSRARCAVLGGLMAAALLPAAAHAAVLGPPDISAAPTAACDTGEVDCTYTDTSLVVPADGVLTSVTFRHGDAQPGDGIAQTAVRILGGTFPTLTLDGGDQGREPSSAAGLETMTFSPGLAVKAGQRIGLYSATQHLAFLAPGSGAASTRGGGAGTYHDRAGLQLQLQARVEPDADGDGYGDETQDACPTVSGPGACPAPQPQPQPQSGGGATSAPANPGGGAQEPEVFVAQGIEAFHAEPIGVYRAATVQRLPGRTDLAAAILRGFSAPVRCAIACQITAYASMRAISGALLAFASRNVVVSRSSGRFPTAGRGRLPLKLTKRARAALQRSKGRRFRITFHITVKDGRHTVRRTQTVRIVRR